MRKINEETEKIVNNEIICLNCNSPKTITLPDGTQIGAECNCEILKMKAEKESIKKSKIDFAKKGEIIKLKQTSDLGRKYYNATFGNSTEMVEHEKAIKYCNNSATGYTKGNSIYLYGATGTGKTRTMACMLNILTDNMFKAYFTRFSDIKRRYDASMKFTEQESQEDVINFYINEVDYLFIDDLGTEFMKVTDLRMQTLIFDIINGRTSKNKPMVISSNYGFTDLVGLGGLNDRTVWRIAEACGDNIINFKGKNWRK